MFLSRLLDPTGCTSTMAIDRSCWTNAPTTATDTTNSISTIRFRWTDSPTGNNRCLCSLAGRAVPSFSSLARRCHHSLHWQGGSHFVVNPTRQTLAGSDQLNLWIDFAGQTPIGDNRYDWPILLALFNNGNILDNSIPLGTLR